MAENTETKHEHRVPKCPECGVLMQPEPYGWWACPTHPWRMVPDKNLPDRDQLLGKPSS